MKEMLETIIKTIVDSPDKVKIDIAETENTNIYELHVAEGEVGMVIGKQGKNISAIRTLLSAATAKAGGKRSLLEIIE
ncbi:MAG: KH domain-containing protein [Candidatus Marinimicrobia bacterium]|jgi:predicted RNA-binding protein YlqC (UPF0109 family)|nr:KH domain-containing protein [Candidatus Neomarinimicrobiota bacterium]MBT6870527.1 KH domain-containing protein [Candidatus Neomarinimicrobiota bacterium]MBT7376524.1 KH domain-containing protein [Candidatus Neomarinimicrobiota bacterium]|tara:strand:+ start:202 stop:435 length:234 start_codon:yes stop_codon:yes gene_type:complete